MKKKIIIVSGYFNPLHKGHIEYFNSTSLIYNDIDSSARDETDGRAVAAPRIVKPPDNAKKTSMYIKLKYGTIIMFATLNCRGVRRIGKWEKIEYWMKIMILVFYFYRKRM